MEAVFLVVHLIVALSIIIVVMIQPAESGGFVGGGNMSNMNTPRRGADLMTRITTILACIFFVTSLSLGIIANNKTERKSILDVAAEQGIEMPVAADKDSQTQQDKKKTKKPAAPISK